MSNARWHAAVNHHAPLMAGAVCCTAWVAAIASAYWLEGASGIITGMVLLVAIPAIWMLSGVTSD